MSRPQYSTEHFEAQQHEAGRGPDYYGPPLAAPLDEAKLAPRIVRRQIAHLECGECHRRFTRSARHLMLSEIRCPGCRSVDVDVV